MPITSRVWSALKAIKKSMKLLISLREPNVGERHEISRESFLLRRTFTFCECFAHILTQFANSSMKLWQWHSNFSRDDIRIDPRRDLYDSRTGCCGKFGIIDFWSFLPRFFVAVMPLHKPPLRDNSRQLSTCQLLTPQIAPQHATDMKTDNEIFLRTRFSQLTPSHNWRFNWFV